MEDATSKEAHILADMYGKRLFESYMQVLDDPGCFCETFSCYKRGHKVFWQCKCKFKICDFLLKEEAQPNSTKLPSQTAKH